MNKNTSLIVAIVAMSVSAACLILLLPGLFNDPSSLHIFTGGVFGVLTVVLAGSALTLKARA